MWDWLHVGLAACGTGYMRDWLHVGLAACGTGCMRDWLHVGLACRLASAGMGSVAREPTLHDTVHELVQCSGMLFDVPILRLTIAHRYLR